ERDPGAALRGSSLPHLLDPAALTRPEDPSRGGIARRGDRDPSPGVVARAAGVLCRNAPVLSCRSARDRRGGGARVAAADPAFLPDPIPSGGPRGEAAPRRDLSYPRGLGAHAGQRRGDRLTTHADPVEHGRACEGYPHFG